METIEKTFGARFKRQLPLILAFVIPLIAMLLVFIQRKIYPFGDRSFLRTDLYHQYAPFFRELKDKFLNGESLLYSWDIGGGTNFVALMAYYLVSPLIWGTWIPKKVNPVLKLASTWGTKVSTAAPGIAPDRLAMPPSTDISRMMKVSLK